MHNRDDSPCAALYKRQGNISENGQRHTQQWGAETVGGGLIASIANDCVTYGSLELSKGLMYSLVQCKSG